MVERERFDIINFENHFKNGRCCYEMDGRSVSIQELDDSYSVQSEPAFPDMVCDFRQYDANTLLLIAQGHFLKNGSAKIGVWQKYDKEGHLVEETNYEEGWKIGWDGLLQLMKKEGIDLRQVVSVLRVRKEVPSDEHLLVWIVGRLVTDSVLVEYSFDGQTGERFYIDFIKMEQ